MREDPELEVDVAQTAVTSVLQADVVRLCCVLQARDGRASPVQL